MKRLILSLVAALLVAGPLPGSVAAAKDKQGGWEQRGGGGGNRGGGPERGGGGNRGGGNGGWRGEERGGPDRRIENRPAPDRRIENRPAPERRQDDRRMESRRPESRGDDGPRWERPNAEAQRAPGDYGVRRGGYMPPNVGAPVEDHNRLRLRTPPRGYSWVRVPGGYAMVSEQTGQIFDMVPTR